MKTAKDPCPRSIRVPVGTTFARSIVPVQVGHEPVLQSPDELRNGYIRAECGDDGGGNK